MSTGLGQNIRTHTAPEKWAGCRREVLTEWEIEGYRKCDRLFSQMMDTCATSVSFSHYSFIVSKLLLLNQTF